MAEQNSHSKIVLTSWMTFKKSFAHTNEPVTLDSKSLCLADVIAVARYGKKIKIDEKALLQGEESVKSLNSRLKENQVIYGTKVVIF